MWAPNLHYNTPNPDIPALQDGSLQVVCKPTPVKGGLVGINSFGFGGSNVHVILRPHDKKKSQPLEARRLPRLVQVFGRTQEAAEKLLDQSKRLGEDDSFVSLLNDLSAIPTSSMPYRGYRLVGSESDVKEVQQIQASGRPLWYICTGNFLGLEGKGVRVCWLLCSQALRVVIGATLCSSFHLHVQSRGCHVAREAFPDPLFVTSSAGSPLFSAVSFPVVARPRKSSALCSMGTGNQTSETGLPCFPGPL